MTAKKITASEAARAMRLVNSEKQRAAARNNGKLGGAPKLCKCSHKRKQHHEKDGEWLGCSECNCQKYQARE